MLELWVNSIQGILSRKIKLLTGNKKAKNVSDTSKNLFVYIKFKIVCLPT